MSGLVCFATEFIGYDDYLYYHRMANTFTNVLLSLLVPEKSPLARQYFTFSVLLTTSHHKFELNNAMNVKQRIYFGG